MKKIFVVLSLFVLFSNGVFALENESKESLENEISFFEEKIDGKLLRSIDNFIENNKENRVFLYKLKEKIQNSQEDMSLLSDEEKNFLKYLEARIDLITLELTEELNRKEVIVTTDALNVRTWPSKDYEKLDMVHLSDKFVLLEEKDGWCRIEISEWTEWWVSREYVVIVWEWEEFNNSEFSSEFWEKVVSIAKKYIWYPYKYWEESPARWFDCSGFVYYVFKEAGKDIARTSSSELAKQWTFVNRDKLEKWDLLFFTYSSTSIGHVWIYIWDNQVIHAMTPALWVGISSIDSGYFAERYVTARRFE